MRLIERGLLTDFLRLFAVIALGLSGIITLLADVIKRADELSGGAETLAYAALVFPRYLTYTIPVASLLCCLYTVGQASRNKELLTVRASGGRISRLFLPLLATGAALSLLVFILGEFVVPECSRAARQIRDAGAGGGTTSLSEGRIWHRADDGSLVRLDLFDSSSGEARGVKVFGFGPTGGISTIIEAQRARYNRKQGVWVLRGVREYDLVSGSLKKQPRKVFSQMGPPDILGQAVEKTYEMGITELGRYLRRLNSAGFKNLRLDVEMHARVSYPLVCIIMVTLGVSIPVMRNIGGLVATGVGLMLSLGYWMGFNLSLSLGYSGAVHPVLAAWAMPVLFGALSARAYMSIPE